jgi:hypothetical protein
MSARLPNWPPTTEVPLIAYMPDLSWWEEGQIDTYLDAVRELLLPQTTVLVGNHSTCGAGCCRTGRQTRARARATSPSAAAEMGVSYVLVTGIVLPDQFIENVLATPQTVMGSEKFERFDASFAGAGDTLAAALAAPVRARPARHPRRRQLAGARLPRRGRHAALHRRAQGAYMWDAEGQRYIDYIGSWGPMILGHGHPAVLEAVQKARWTAFQLRRTHRARDRTGRGHHRAGARMEQVRLVSRAPRPR